MSSIFETYKAMKGEAEGQPPNVMDIYRQKQADDGSARTAGDAPNVMDIYRQRSLDEVARLFAATRIASERIDPTRQARALEVAARENVPVSTAYEFLDQMEHKPRQPTFRALAEKAPLIAQLAADPDKGPVVFGDEERLSDIETSLRDFARSLQKEPKPAPGTPLIEQVFGAGSMYLTPEQQVIEQDRLVRERAAEMEAARQRIGTAREDARALSEQIGMIPALRGEPPLTDAEIDGATWVRGAVQASDDARERLQQALMKAPVMSAGMDRLNMALGLIPKAFAEAGKGFGELRDTLRQLSPIAADIMDMMTPGGALSSAIAQLAGDVSFDGEGRSAFTRMMADAVRRIEELLPRDPVQAEGTTTRIMEAIGSVLPFLVAGAASKALRLGPGVGAGILGAMQQASQSADDARRFNAGQAQRQVATIIGMLSGAVEAIPAERLFAIIEDVGGASFARALANVVKQAFVEGGQEIAQQLPVDVWARLTYDPKRDVAGNAVEAGALGLVAGGFWGGLATLAAKSRPAREAKAALDRMGEAVKASRTAEIAPQLIDEQIKAMAEGGVVPGSVTAPVGAVTTLLQDVDPADVGKLYPGLADAIREAITTGAEVQIPAELLARLAKLPGWQNFTGDVRALPDGLTPNEIDALEKELNAWVEEQAKVKPPPAFDEEGSVFQTIRDQLISAGHDKDVAKAQASLFAATMENLARRVGKPVKEFFERYNFTITNAALESMGKEGLRVLSEKERGSIAFTAARDFFRVTLTEQANLSTFLHESGHFFLEVMQDIEARGEADARMLEDLRVVRDWLGVESGKAITRNQHEKFARGFEAYLMEGKAPSNALREVFNRFKAWLVFTYRRLANLNVKLSDDVRGVFDRLIASEAAIADARVQTGWREAPLTREQLGMTEAEYASYVEAWNRATDSQQMAADARVMLEATRELKAAWRKERDALRAELEADIRATRGWRIWQMIATGKGWENVRADMAGARIDPASVDPRWKADARDLMAKDGQGLHIDTMAVNLGFRNGEQMMQVIAAAKMAMRQIPAKVRAIMAERHGELNAERLAREALKAVQNDPSIEVLLTEYRAMADAAGLKMRKGLRSELLRLAREKVAALPQRDINAHKWRRAELDAARRSGAAAARGDKVTAAAEKRRQLYAAAMVRASMDAMDRIERIRDYLMAFTTTKRRAQLGLAGDFYLDGIDQILEGVELKEVPLKLLDKRPLLAEIVRKAEEDGDAIDIPDEVLGLGKKNWRQMSLDELEAVHDAVANLWHLAKLKNKLRLRHEQITIEKAIATMRETADANLRKVKSINQYRKSFLDRARLALRWGRARLNKVEFITGWIDGKPSGGMAHQVIYQPISDARFAEFTMMKEVSALILDRLRNMPREQKARWNTVRTFMGIEMHGHNIIAAALNLGNAQNKQKLLEGYGWNEAQFRAELDAFMTKADWDMVQHIWDSIDKLWPHIERTSKRLTGLAPPKVEAEEVVTPFGTYKGGYYPIAYDRSLNPDIADRMDKTDFTQGLSIKNVLLPAVRSGATKKRTGYTGPLLLSLEVISRHLAEQIHYITHAEAVVQAHKVMRHPRFRALVIDHFGEEHYGRMKEWLVSVARGTLQRPNHDFAEPIMRHLRAGTSIAAMGFNVFSALKQQFGVITALDAVGPVYWANGLAKTYLSINAAENWRYALDSSKELRPMVEEFDRDIKMIGDAYRKKVDAGAVDWIVTNSFALMAYSQLAVNVATWHGAYAQAIDQGLDHARAVDHADSVVRKTQSSGAIKDLADVQVSNEATRLLTMFYSYFSVLFNRIDDIVRTTRGMKDVPRALRRIAVLVILPAIVNVASQDAWKAMFGGDDDDAEPFAVRVGVESVSMLLATVPGLQYVAGTTRGELSPVTSSAENITRAMVALRDLAMTGDGLTRGEARTIVRAISVATKTPVSSIYNVIDELANGPVTRR